MKKSKEFSIFIVTGRTGHSLVVSKAMPFAFLEKVKNIYIFSESEGFEIPKSRYITIPLWIRNSKHVALGKILRFFYEPLQLLYYSFKFKPDFINGVYCLPKGLNSFIVSRLSGVKCVNSIIGSILEIETELPVKPVWRSINLWQLKRCEALTIKGETDRRYLASKGISNEKMFMLNGAIDIEKFCFSNEVRATDLLFMGSFIELKGADRIIRIVRKLIPIFPGLKVVMVGDGRLLKKTQKMALDLDVFKNISFKGYQKNTVPYFQSSKLLVMPSRSESLPTSMLEAMACGCVPVISEVGNVPEAAHDQINARVISDYMDLDGFSMAISELLSDEELRLKLSLSGRKTVEKYYSVKSQSEDAENIINYLNRI